MLKHIDKRCRFGDDLVAVAEDHERLRWLSSGSHREGTEYVNDLVTGFEWVAKRQVESDLVNVMAAILGQVDIASLDKVMNDAVYGAFADTNFASDLSEANLGVLGDADQDVGVVAQKGPRRNLGRLFGESTDHGLQSTGPVA